MVQAELRVLGSGQKRKSGVGKGVDSRTVNQGSDLRQRAPGLDGVLAKEGLPATGPLPPGELKHLERIGLKDIPEQVQQPKMRPKSLAGG